MNCQAAVVLDLLDQHKSFAKRAKAML